MTDAATIKAIAAVLRRAGWTVEPPEPDGAAGQKALVAALAVLRARNWTALPPELGEIPTPRVGEVWQSLDPRIEPRRVIWIGMKQHSAYEFLGPVECVQYAAPSWPDQVGLYVTLKAWTQWAKKKHARPTMVETRSYSTDVGVADD
jgi:hypothetical protein